MAIGIGRGGGGVFNHGNFTYGLAGPFFNMSTEIRRQ